jgi:hypothetical protein
MRYLGRFAGLLHFGFREFAAQVGHLECEWKVRQYGTDTGTARKPEQPKETTVHVVPLSQAEARFRLL